MDNEEKSAKILGENLLDVARGKKTGNAYFATMEMELGTSFPISLSYKKIEESIRVKKEIRANWL